MTMSQLAAASDWQLLRAKMVHKATGIECQSFRHASEAEPGSNPRLREQLSTSMSSNLKLQFKAAIHWSQEPQEAAMKSSAGDAPCLSSAGAATAAFACRDAKHLPARRGGGAGGEAGGAGSLAGVRGEGRGRPAISADDEEWKGDTWREERAATWCLLPRAEAPTSGFVGDERRAREASLTSCEARTDAMAGVLVASPGLPQFRLEPVPCRDRPS